MARITQARALDALLKSPLLYNDDQQNLAASLAATTLLTPAPAGLYRINAYIRTHTAGSGNVVTSVAFTDNIGAKTMALPATLALGSGGYASGTAVFWAASGTISYSTTYSSTGNYDITVVLERLV